MRRKIKHPAHLQEEISRMTMMLDLDAMRGVLPMREAIDLLERALVHVG